MAVDLMDPEITHGPFDLVATNEVLLLVAYFPSAIFMLAITETVLAYCEVARRINHRIHIKMLQIAVLVGLHLTALMYGLQIICRPFQSHFPPLMLQI